MGWPTALFIIAMMIGNIIILGCTAYAVFWLGYSGWWFLLAILCCGTGETARDIARDAK